MLPVPCVTGGFADPMQAQVVGRRQQRGAKAQEDYLPLSKRLWNPVLDLKGSSDDDSDDGPVPGIAGVHSLRLRGADKAGEGVLLWNPSPSLAVTSSTLPPPKELERAFLFSLVSLRCAPRVRGWVWFLVPDCTEQSDLWAAAASTGHEYPVPMGVRKSLRGCFNFVPL